MKIGIVIMENERSSRRWTGNLKEMNYYLGFLYVYMCA